MQINRRGMFCALFLIALLVTEFFYIEIGGGVARIYHFWAVSIVLLMAGSIPRLLKSDVFIALLIFATVNVIAALLSDQSMQAFTSLMSFFANICVAMAVALVLLRSKLSVERMTNIILGVTLVTIAWGLMQIFAFKIGYNLALSPQQEPQILIGFGPGFRTEANTFGKYMLLPFLLFLPAYLKNLRDRTLQFAYAIMIIGILMNFTRTALIGLAVALVFAFVWYLVTGQLSYVSVRAVKIALVVVLSLTLIASGAVKTSDYARYKLENFFNKEEILEGGSSRYRLMAMNAVIDSTVTDSKRLVIGNGWGQTYSMIFGQEVQAGGGDSVNILGYAGTLGVFFYLLYSWRGFLSLVHIAKRRINPKLTMIAEGLVFVFVGMFITGQISGFLIAPEYWLLIGMCIYLNLVEKFKRNSMVEV